MLFRFQSPAGADVIMLGPNGEQVLNLLGKAPTPQGIIVLDELPEAMTRLEQALLDDDARFEALVAEAQARGERVPKREPITLRQRIWPLLELMRHSMRAERDLTWNA